MRRVISLVLPLSIIFAACVGDSTPGGGDGGGDATNCSKVCNETCVSGTDPATGCGGSSCDPCPGATAPHAVASCNAGACATSCATGYADCDKNTATGCETNVASDTANCGKCGNVCGIANTTAVSCGSAGSAGDAGASDAATDGGAAQSGTCIFTCDGAHAHCSTDDSTGCETNIGTDANNCGACGHSCGGGACVGGYCQPVILAGDPTKYTGLKSLYGLTVLNGNVYGTDWEAPGPNNGLVYKVSTTPGGTLQWLVGGPVSAGGTGVTASADYITTDGTSLTYAIYHVGEGQGAGIWNVHTDGTQNTLVVSGGSTGGGPACNLSTAYGYEVAGVAFDSSYIYWIRDTYGGCSVTSCQCQGIYRSNANGTGVTQYFTSAWYTLPLADSGTLYMVDFSNAQVVVATSQTFTNNTPPTALPKGGTPTALKTDANYVYWLDQGNKKFYRAKKIGATTADDITPTSGMPTGTLANTLMVDASANKIYFVSPDASYSHANTQQIYVMPKDGSGPAQAIPGAVISSYGDSMTAFAQDASALYWSTYGFDGPSSGCTTCLAPPPYSAVYKLAK